MAEAVHGGDELETRLRERFGLPSFRPWQREAIDALLFGQRKALVVAPTGGGKSLCYQFPATELEGTTLVVSPLIALMEDQVRGLRERGIAATWLSSTVPSEERAERMRGVRDGAYKLVYIAPERLATSGTVEALKRLAPPLVAIDEAHCISQWGHDFRPDYLRIREAIQSLQPKHILACTATATPFVREEIVRQLGLAQEETAVILRGFARPNLHLEVQEIEGTNARIKAAAGVLQKAIGSPNDPQGGAIIYAATRRKTEQVAPKMAELGYRAAAYHAGLSPEERADVNARFAAKKLDVVVATNAFGMGIDRPDIRAVVHVQAPGSIEAYYQEVGRAGRDGQPAYGLLLSGGADFGLRRRILEFGREGDDEASREAVERQWRLFLDVMRYVEAGSCRHDHILRYFGDDEELLGGCGHCDVCEHLEDHAELSDEARAAADLLVRKALSGVARNRGRMGLNSVAEMLHGANTEKLKRHGMDTLSTFGLMKEQNRPWITALLRRLITAGLLNITAEDYPKPFLTPKGVAVMKGEDDVRVLLPPDDVGKPRRLRNRREKKSVEVPKGVDSELFERLRAERREVAVEKGVPPYVICHDRTLIEIAAIRPHTLAELAQVHGMGPARLSAYGERLLSVVDG